MATTDRHPIRRNTAGDPHASGAGVVARLRFDRGSFQHPRLRGTRSLLGADGGGRYLLCQEEFHHRRFLSGGPQDPLVGCRAVGLWHATLCHHLHGDPGDIVRLRLAPFCRLGDVAAGDAAGDLLLLATVSASRCHDRLRVSRGSFLCGGAGARQRHLHPVSAGTDGDRAATAGDRAVGGDGDGHLPVHRPDGDPGDDLHRARRHLGGDLDRCVAGVRADRRGAAVSDRDDPGCRRLGRDDRVGPGRRQVSHLRLALEQFRHGRLGVDGRLPVHQPGALYQRPDGDSALPHHPR